MSSMVEGATTTKSGRNKAKGMKVVSWSQKTDLQFPMGRIVCYLGRYSQRVGSGADPFLNLNLHFFIVQGVGVFRKCCIIPRHIQLPMKNDEEFGKLLTCATISNGGVVPNNHQTLLPKMQGRGKSKPEIRSPSQEF
ncbi:hypothetical protein ZIOFF_044388 [Zingiber officinale]|uniref:Histone H2A n=1 Tax=Zingiber officinale TaxID=94328 RepID=A0A8J5FYF0_ZINOF|nr:hypothetical protein ZIOFF_044388 [Zingiber officinale]